MGTVQGTFSMTDKSQQQGQPKPASAVHSDGTSQALSTALKKTFEALTEEPVPEKFQELIARIRAEEARRTSGENDDGNNGDNDN